MPKARNLEIDEARKLRIQLQLVRADLHTTSKSLDAERDRALMLERNAVKLQGKVSALRKTILEASLNAARLEGRLARVREVETAASQPVTERVDRTTARSGVIDDGRLGGYLSAGEFRSMQAEPPHWLDD